MPNPPVDPALEEKVARALILRSGGHFEAIRDMSEKKAMADARAALAALTTDDLLALLSARSDEVVVSFDREAAEEGVAALRAGLSHAPEPESEGHECPACRFVAKLSTALGEGSSE